MTTAKVKPKIETKDRNMIEKRLEDLEIKFAYHEETVDALNQVIIRQQREIEQLQDMLSVLKQKLDLVIQNQSTEQGTAHYHEPPPPHY